MIWYLALLQVLDLHSTLVGVYLGGGHLSESNPTVLWLAHWTGFIGAIVLVKLACAVIIFLAYLRLAKGGRWSPMRLSLYMATIFYTAIVFKNYLLIASVV